MRFPPEPDQVHDSGTLVLVKGFTWLPSLRKPGHEKNSSDEAASLWDKLLTPCSPATPTEGSPGPRGFRQLCFRVCSLTGAGREEVGREEDVRVLTRTQHSSVRKAEGILGRGPSAFT